MDYNVNVTYAEDECESEEEYLQRVSDYLNSTVEPSSCWVDPLSELDQACAGAAEEGGLVLVRGCASAVVEKCCFRCSHTISLLLHSSPSQHQPHSLEYKSPPE